MNEFSYSKSSPSYIPYDTSLIQNITNNTTLKPSGNKIESAIYIQHNKKRSNIYCFSFIFNCIRTFKKITPEIVDKYRYFMLNTFTLK